MDNIKISTKEALTIIIVLITTSVIFTYDRIIVHSCGSSSILNVIYISIIAILFVFLISLLYKKFTSFDIIDISEIAGGKILKVITGILFYTYFIISSSSILKRVADCLQIIYYPMTNIIFIILLFIITAAIICSFKNIGIFKTTSMFCSIVILSIILIFIGNSKTYTTANMFPLFGYGIKSTFLDNLSNIAVFNGIAYLYFLPPILKRPDQFKKISIISILISAILLLVTITNILFIFNYSLTNIEIFPLYISVRYIEFGTFLQRLDSIFLSLCIVGAILSLSLTVSFCINIFKKTFNLCDSKPIIIPSILFIFSLSMLIKDYPILNFFEDTLSKYMFFILIILISSIVLIWANIKRRIKKI